MKHFAIMRKHYKAYLSGFPGAREMRLDLMEQTSADDAIRRARAFLSSVS